MTPVPSPNPASMSTLIWSELHAYAYSHGHAEQWPDVQAHLARSWALGQRNGYLLAAQLRDRFGWEASDELVMILFGLGQQ